MSSFVINDVRHRASGRHSLRPKSFWLTQKKKKKNKHFYPGKWRPTSHLSPSIVFDGRRTSVVRLISNNRRLKRWATTVWTSWIKIVIDRYRIGRKPILGEWYPLTRKLTVHLGEWYFFTWKLTVYLGEGSSYVLVKDVYNIIIIIII